MSKKYEPKVELMDVEKIKPYEKNAKVHTEGQVAALVNVIKTQGWDVPIVVDKDGIVIKGHGRRLAALSLGMKQVPVIVRRDLTPAQVRAARLSDNQVAIGDFDIGLVKEELADLQSEGFNIGEMGFGEKELNVLLGDLDTIDFDAFEEVSTSESAATSQDKIEAILLPLEQSPTGGKTAQVIDLIGFKSIPFSKKDDLIEFLALCESKTSLKGQDAFMAYIKIILDEQVG